MEANELVKDTGYTVVSPMSVGEDGAWESVGVDSEV